MLRIREAVSALVEKHPEATPLHALTYILIVCRGGSSDAQLLTADLMAWVCQYGMPTWRNLKQSMEEVDFGFRVGEATIKALRSEHTQGHRGDQGEEGLLEAEGAGH
jgi:hypothetical protein